LKKAGIVIPACWNCFAVSSIFRQTLIENQLENPLSVVNGCFRLLQICLTFCNQTLIEKFQTDFD
jgi:hypothetical protein